MPLLPYHSLPFRGMIHQWSLVSKILRQRFCWGEGPTSVAASRSFVYQQCIKQVTGECQ